jgi:hypothetical protein
MKHFIGCDAHKKYSLFVIVDEAGEAKPAVRVNHDRESYRTFLRGLPGRSSIAVETVGNWYWILTGLLVERDLDESKIGTVNGTIIIEVAGDEGACTERSSVLFVVLCKTRYGNSRSCAVWADEARNMDIRSARDRADCLRHRPTTPRPLAIRCQR